MVVVAEAVSVRSRGASLIIALTLLAGGAWLWLSASSGTPTSPTLEQSETKPTVTGGETAVPLNAPFTVKAQPEPSIEREPIRPPADPAAHHLDKTLEHLLSPAGRAATAHDRTDIEATQRDQSMNPRGLPLPPEQAKVLEALVRPLDKQRGEALHMQTLELVEAQKAAVERGDFRIQPNGTGMNYEELRKEYGRNIVVSVVPGSNLEEQRLLVLRPENSPVLFQLMQAQKDLADRRAAVIRNFYASGGR